MTQPGFIQGRSLKFLPLLFLLGCATTSYDELYAQASECTSVKAIGCDALWEEINRRDEAKERRAKGESPIECGQNMLSARERIG